MVDKRIRGQGASQGGEAGPAPPWKVRNLERDDLPWVAAIERASFPDPWSPGALAQELLTDSSWHEVAVDPQGKVAGFLIGRMYGDEWHLMDLAVDPERRRMGVGSVLVESFLHEADAAGTPVILEVRPSNTAGRALYQNYDFAVVGRRPRYYVHAREDAAVMARQPRRSLLSDAASRSLSPDCGPAPSTFVRRQGGDGHNSAPGPLLAIETSCDDSSAAVLSTEGVVLSNVVHSQDAIHERYGGVVPEVASRAHVERLTVVVREALRQAGVEIENLAAVAATVGPGLIGALLVGVQTAKAIAWSRRLPFYPVNHLHGHLAAVWLGDREAPYPMVTLVASGGHTSLIRVDDRRTFSLLGQTLDDAAGEAFDKGARLLGLGYPGGKELDALAESGDPATHDFPIGLGKSPRLDFSFSGVKTALYYLLREMDEDERVAQAADIAASYREAIVKALMQKTLRAAEQEQARTVAVAGGVAANSLLRRRLVDQGKARGLHVVVPPFAYCTDNAAMIGAAALPGPVLPYPTYLDVDASASLALGQWQPSRASG